MGPERVYEALTTGPMKAVGDTLTETERKMVSASVGGRILGSAGAGEAQDMPNRCKTNPPVRLGGPAWNGWGGDMQNTRFRARTQAGLTAKDLPRLKLRWAFGLPNSTSAYSQPTVVGGRVFIGADTGNVYAIDARTGCVHWSYRAVAGVRVPPVVGPAKAAPAVYVQDLRDYCLCPGCPHRPRAVEAELETNFTGRVTAGASLYRGVLFVPLSSWEEFSAKTLDYGCCTPMGAVAAVDAATGKRLWKTYVIAHPPAADPQEQPGRAAIWPRPAARSGTRRPSIPGTARSISAPATAPLFRPARRPTAVMALDMKTGQGPLDLSVHHGDLLVGCRSGPAHRQLPAMSRARTGIFRPR